MKKLAILGALFIGFNAFGQDAVTDINHDQILYRGFENKIALTSIQDDQPFELETINCRVISQQENTYIIKTDNAAKTAKINVISNDKTVQSLDFKVENLPSPSLYWGDNRAGSTPSNVREMSIHYAPGVQLDANFEIVAWTATVDGKTFQDEGSSVSQEMIDYVETLTAGESVSIEVKVKGADGIVRKLAGTWMK